MSSLSLSLTANFSFARCESGVQILQTCSHIARMARHEDRVRFMEENVPEHMREQVWATFPPVMAGEILAVKDLRARRSMLESIPAEQGTLQLRDEVELATRALFNVRKARRSKR